MSTCMRVCVYACMRVCAHGSTKERLSFPIYWTSNDYKVATILLIMGKVLIYNTNSDCRWHAVQLLFGFFFTFSNLIQYHHVLTIFKPSDTMTLTREYANSASDTFGFLILNTCRSTIPDFHPSFVLLTWFSWKVRHSWGCRSPADVCRRHMALVSQLLVRDMGDFF